MKKFYLLLNMEIRLAIRQPIDSLLMLGFSLISLMLLTISSDPTQLSHHAPGFLWIVILFSLLLQLDSIWIRDAESGRLAILLCQPIPCWLIMLAKASGLWLRTGLSWILFAPMFGLMMQLPIEALPILITSLLIGTPSLCLLVTIGGCLTLGARQQTLLVMIIVLPLLIPILIFGAFSINHSSHQSINLLWLGVCFSSSLLCIPIGAISLRNLV